MFAAIPSLTADDDSVFSTWAALVARLVGAGLLVAAALVPHTRVYHPRRRHRQRLLAVVAGVKVFSMIVSLLERVLPRSVVVKPSESGRPQLETSAVILGSQLAALVLFSVAACGFTRKAERSGDPMGTRSGWPSIW